eukprot:jgi/Chlat1/2604/Chrsp178S02454
MPAAAAMVGAAALAQCALQVAVAAPGRAAPSLSRSVGSAPASTSTRPLLCLSSRHCSIQTRLPQQRRWKHALEDSRRRTRRTTVRMSAQSADAAWPSSSPASSSSSAASNLPEWMQLPVSLGAFMWLDIALRRLFDRMAIQFPSALGGMFLLFGALLLADKLQGGEGPATRVVLGFVEPARSFLRRWLALFFAPSMVVLPLVMREVAAAELVKMTGILCVLWFLSMVVTAWTAVFVRKLARTELGESKPVTPQAPHTQQEVLASGAVTLAGAAFALAAFRSWPSLTIASATQPFFLAASVFGYVVGARFPPAVKKYCHPIITCSILLNIAAFAMGAVSGLGYETILGGYLTKVASNVGAGDILLGLLGPVVLSFAFSMYDERELMQRHAAEIFTSVPLSALFSLFSTVAAGRMARLTPGLTRSLAPRCVTVALALPINTMLQGSNSSMTALAVFLTGLIGAMVVAPVMDAFGFRDPVVRGLSTACSAHGLGTAALAAKEPESLPFCAIALALTAIFSTVFVAIPPIRTALIAIAG